MRLRPAKRIQGVTIIELVIVMAIGMVLVAVATPSFLRSVRSYQLNSTARNLSMLMQSTRYTAIQRNRSVGFVASESGTLFWVDPNYSTGSYTPTWQSTFPQIKVTGNLTLVTTGMPSFSSMGLAVAPTVLAPYTTDSTLLVFSSRGTLTSVNNGASPNVAVMCFRNSDGAYAAVTVTPTGTAKVWSYQGNAWK